MNRVGIYRQIIYYFYKLFLIIKTLFLYKNTYHLNSKIMNELQITRVKNAIQG